MHLRWWVIYLSFAMLYFLRLKADTLGSRINKRQNKKGIFNFWPVFSGLYWATNQIRVRTYILGFGPKILPCLHLCLEDQNRPFAVSWSR